ncbi:MipA/OmpV family protein [Pseudoalteromonas spongiae]|uniref:MipA/OmpV family protein n=1 Tax=Pseudoalteromonas spongiae TaxID=298657 RepID=A0ABU8EXZ6_9GAMM
MLMRWIALSLLFISTHSVADEVTFGIGAFYSSLPHYLGSEQNESYVVPLPHIHIEKEYYKVERNEFESFYEVAPNHYISVSAGGAIAVSSKDNRAREGMDDLAWVGEIGPSYQYFSFGNPTSDDYLYISPFIRKAYAFDGGDIDDIGSVYGVMLEAGRQIYQDGQHQVNLTGRFSTRFGSHAYNSYFYHVAEQFQTIDRLSFDADAGYLASVFSLGLTYDNDWLWAGGFLRYYNYSHSANQQSPLLRDNHNVALGFGFAWKFYSLKN